MRQSEQYPPVVRFARPVQTPGLELVHYPRLERGWRGIPEAYTWFTMIDQLDGNVDVISRGVRARCEPGSVTVGAPGESYALQPRTEMRGEFRVVRVDNRIRASIADEIGPRHREEFSPWPERDPAIARSFARLYAAIDGGDPLAAHERLYEFVAAMSVSDVRGRTVRKGRDARGIRRARELLHAKFAAALSLDELARAAGMDKFTLLRTFSREFGITPGAYQVQLRMARACRLITDGLPLAEIAAVVGYSEQSALHRPFRRLVGVTPGDYARAIR
jgi:AraC-like DNA-binding protein